MLQGEAAMAARGSLTDLCNEMSCPICLEYFREPVILDCGHNFCQACLTQCWGESGTGASCCPECRETFQQRHFKPNRHLANVVEIARKLQEGKLAEGTRGVCEKHQEPLKLFCNDDQAPICVVCDRSKEHKAHSVVPAEEAAQEYKEKIKILLMSLEKKREQFVNWKEIQELRSQEFMLEEDKQKVRSAIGRMHKILEEKEHEWLSQLEEMEKQMEKKKEENVGRLSEEISHLSRLITEMEGKCQQPSHEFLQDLKSTLNRYKKEQVEHAVGLSTWLQWRLTACSQKCSALGKAVEKCAESLEEVLKEECLEALDQALNKGSLKRMRHRVNVILDPDTAHPCLIVSPDLKSVRWGSKKHDILDSPEQFENMFCVLGHGKFSSGKHWWEVEVEVEEMEEAKMRALWAVGVAPDSVMRKGGRTVPTPEEGFLVVGKLFTGSLSSGQLQAFTSPNWTTLTLNHEPRKIRVSLDHEESCVEFFDADTDDLIFTFPSASFSGEMIRPFFFLAGNIRMNC
ncbi:zinc finger protein RFP-like [Heteronotia binoei]|uniref:zinc finger protein RFP-like n=1 Tax=Heteronotia binoei TaxID=13085 RepID=UPI00293031FF|nr:zinc finger protein RFP-like [Heteronotia binoei]